MDLDDAIYQFLALDIFQQVSIGTGSDRFQYQMVFRKRGQNDDFDFREPPLDGQTSIYAIPVRQSEIQQYYIRASSWNGIEGFLEAPGFTTNLNTFIQSHDQPQSIPDDIVIIDNKYSNHDDIS